MTTADRITSVRLFLAPVFFAVYLLHRFGLPSGWAEALLSRGLAWTVPVLWALFVVSELTDLLDGQVARRGNQSGDFGKLFDPFADVLVRITYFLCFVVDGILPVPLFLVVLYREFGIQFLRNLMMKKGVAMGARWGGKIKAVAYMVAGALALAASSVARLGLGDALAKGFRLASVAVFALSVVLALTSFWDYAALYLRTGKPPENS